MGENIYGSNNVVSLETRTIHNVTSITLIVLGAPCNIIPIVAILRSKLYKQETNIFILNLAINNALLCCVCVPYISAMSFIVDNRTHQVNPTLCVLMGYLTYSISGAEILGILLISMNRFVAIVYYEKYHAIFTNKLYLTTMLTISWLLYAILTALPASGVWGDLHYDPQRFFCQPFYGNDSFSKFVIIFVLVTTIPTLVVCYFGIFRKVWLTRQRINTLTNAANKNRKQWNQQEGQLLITVICIVVSFCVLFIPFFFISFLDPQMERYSPTVHVGTMYLALMHSVVDPLMYVFMNSQIKAACLACIKCKPNVIKDRNNETI